MSYRRHRQAWRDVDLLSESCTRLTYQWHTDRTVILRSEDSAIESFERWSPSWSSWCRFVSWFMMYLFRSSGTRTEKRMTWEAKPQVVVSGDQEKGIHSTANSWISTRDKCSSRRNRVICQTLVSNDKCVWLFDSSPLVSWSRWWWCHCLPYLPCLWFPVIMSVVWYLLPSCICEPEKYACLDKKKRDSCSLSVLSNAVLNVVKQRRSSLTGGWLLTTSQAD